mmetsp:Transcript_15916/g.46441  ORF Transcript_15916/g.46441 Transcript_15916/m.46441 type:complete len:266 (+) Transcript_15916:485-1282(+)
MWLLSWDRTVACSLPVALWLSCSSWSFSDVSMTSCCILCIASAVAWKPAPSLPRCSPEAASADMSTADSVSSCVSRVRESCARPPWSASSSMDLRMCLMSAAMVPTDAGDPGGSATSASPPPAAATAADPVGGEPGRIMDRKQPMSSWCLRRAASLSACREDSSACKRASRLPAGSRVAAGALLEGSDPFPSSAVSGFLWCLGLGTGMRGAAASLSLALGLCDSMAPFPTGTAASAPLVLGCVCACLGSCGSSSLRAVRSRTDSE